MVTRGSTKCATVVLRNVRTAACTLAHRVGTPGKPAISSRRRRTLEWMNGRTYAVTACIVNGIHRADSSPASNASSTALAASERSDP